MKRMKGIRLQILISLLIFLVIVSTVAITWTISMSSYKKNSTENHMINNLNYVEKLSSMTEHHLNQMLQTLISIAHFAGTYDISQEDLDGWFLQNRKNFNSTFITDEKGIIQFISPEKIEFEDGIVVTEGAQLTKHTMERLKEEKQAFITEPYRSVSGHLIILLVAPIVDNDTGTFKGAISGSIHLERDNVLVDILGDHRYDESTYVYVVDRNGNLIYHPVAERIWENVLENEVVQKVINGENGSQVVINTENREFLASYAYVPSVGWGIVSQTETMKVNEPVSTLFWRIVSLTIPFLIIVLILSGWLVSTITKPINTLAHYSEQMIHKNSFITDIKLPHLVICNAIR